MIPFLLASLLGADPAAEFDRTVKPVITTHCAKCHTGDKLRGGLDLGSAASTLRGSKAGPVLMPGNADASLLVQVLAGGHDTHMPPSGQLTDAEIETFRRWVGSLPREAVGKRKELQVTEQDKQHWAFRALSSAGPPGPGHPIDSFIDARLREASLTRSPPAEPHVFLRRLSYSLTGLPPTPEQVDRFAEAAKRSWPDAVAAEVDRLLADTAYGERWARHWLDLARYVDTDADVARGEAPLSAHNYRDYVIRSFNADKPYARFLSEQIAGDLLADAGRDGIIATAFLRLTPLPMADGERSRADELDDMVATTSSVALGLTVGCARCHDHKTDPIPQRDYYRLCAIFADTRRQNVPVPDPAELAAFTAAQEARDRQRAEIRRKLDEFATDTRDRYDEFDRPDPNFVGPPAMSNWWRTRLREVQQLEARLRDLDADQARAKTTPAVGTLTPTPKQYLLLRGDPRSPADEVEPGLPLVLQLDTGGTSEARRLTLARKLTEPLHPLAARVMVNRVWHYHFGRGLVDTPSNFGPAGGKPTHPELLDWLSGEFIRSGGSLKSLHRLIVTSGTYQQSSKAGAAAAERDADNRLWSRFARRRLEAEAIRDSVLYCSGRLNAVQFGPGARARPSDANLTPEAARSPLAVREGPQQWRRSIYLSVTRSAPSVMLESFDQPAPACPCDVRPTTTVAPQALLMLNAPFLLEQSEHLARRVRKEAGADVGRQVDRLYRIVLARAPRDTEMELARKFLADPAIAARPGRRPGSDDPGSLSDLAHVLLNLNEFVWID